MRTKSDKLILILIIFLAGCGSTKKLERPVEKYKELNLKETSFLNIPIEIDIAALESSIEKDMGGVLYEDKEMTDDGVMLTLRKQGPIDIKADTNNLFYQLPLEVYIKYDAGLTNVEGRGKIKLDFLTQFDIDPTWNLSTSTNIERFEWIEKPRIRVMGVNLSVGFLGDLILNNTKGVITKTIDNLVVDNLPLRNMVQQAWVQLQEPYLVSEEYNTWLMVNPKTIGMTPLQTNNRKIESKIFVESRPQIRVGDRPGPSGGSYLLPPFEFANSQSDGFALYVTAELTYEEAERLAREQVVGEVYEYGKKSFKIENIDFFGQDDDLVVDVLLSGSYNGNIYLTGRPEYNERRNTIDIKDLKYTLKTKNLLYKTAGFILKSTFKNKIEETLNFYLTYNLEEAKQQIKEQLSDYKITNGVSLKGDLNDLAIQNVSLTPVGMQVDVLLDGKLSLEVKGLN